MKNENNPPVSAKLARELVLNEIFDLTLYKRLVPFASGETAEMLHKLIEVETRHVKFWQDFFNLPLRELIWTLRFKLSCFVLFARVFRERGIHLLIEAIEIHGIKNYLHVWEIYKNDPLGDAVRGILNDEFKHEDEIVSLSSSRKIHPERVRNIFLGFNDGLVEIIGAVSGFFAAFQTASAVLIAGLTVAVAGSLSMAAGAFAAISSEYEIENIEKGRKKFLGEETEEDSKSSPAASAAVVGISYFIGAAIPILPVFFGAQNLIFSIISALAVVIFISYFLAFVSGMSVARRIGMNIVIIVIAVSITYGMGVLAKNVFGINI
ncbi:MAG: VIT1/CCC1 transporter family protein [Patescibacteria group bacterium]